MCVVISEWGADKWRAYEWMKENWGLQRKITRKRKKNMDGEREREGENEEQYFIGEAKMVLDHGG